MVWVIIIAVIAIIIIYRFGKNSGEAIGRVKSDGGMRLKYAVLIKHILGGHNNFGNPNLYKGWRFKLRWFNDISYPAMP